MNRRTSKDVQPKVLFTTPILQHPPVGGPYLRIENSIKALARISDLYIYSRVPLGMLGGMAGLSFYKVYCKAFCFAPSCAPIVHLLKRAINLIAKKTIKRNLLDWRREDYQHLLNIARRIKADVIWLGYGNISYPLLKYIKTHSDYKVVLDTDSVWSRFVLRGLPYAQDDKERQKIEQAGREKEEEEVWGTQLADVTTAVSEVDADYYRHLAKYPEQVHIFSNVIDIDAYRQVPPPANQLKKPCIYLAGSFGPRSPMDDAARRVINNVLPLVRQHLPEIHFYIVGSGSDRTLSDINDPHITITGKLSSVLPYLCYADVALVPLRFESGTRFKILEAAACGIPVVSTTLGAEGLLVTHGKDILIADEPSAFADAIVRLIADAEFATRIGENLSKLVRERYSLHFLVEEGRHILEHLMSASSVPAPTG